MKRVLLTEGISDAIIINEILKLLGANISQCAISPKDCIEKREHFEKAIERITTLDSYTTVLFTRGNSFLAKLVDSLLDQLEDISLGVIYDSDGIEINRPQNTQKVINELNHTKEIYKEKLSLFAFGQDLEAFLVEYLRTVKPEWFQKVVSCTDLWLECLQVSESFMAWKNSKNQELLLASNLCHEGRRRDILWKISAGISAKIWLGTRKYRKNCRRTRPVPFSEKIPLRHRPQLKYTLLVLDRFRYARFVRKPCSAPACGPRCAGMTNIIVVHLNCERLLRTGP